MRAEDEELHALLRETLACGHPLTEYYAAAERAGFGFGDALLAIEDWEPTDDGCCVWLGDTSHHVEGEDPFTALVTHAGGRAPDLLERAGEWVDLEEWQRDAIARHALVRTFEASRSVRDRLAALESQRGEHVGWWYMRVASEASLTEILECSDALAPHQQAALAAALRERHDALELLPHLVEQVGSTAAVEMLVRFWGVPRSTETDPWLALTDALAKLLAARDLPVRRAIVWASRERDVRAWAPVLRRHGLSASAVALHVVESGRDGDLAGLPSLLRSAGYDDDEVVRALLENGLGTRATLERLRDADWSLDRLVRALRERGWMPHEVREELAALGVARSSIRGALARHLDPEEIELAFDE